MKSLNMEDVQRDIELRLINFNNIRTNNYISSNDKFEETFKTENYTSTNLSALEEETQSIIIENNDKIDDFIKQNIDLSNDIAILNEIHIDDFVPIAVNEQMLSLKENEIENTISEDVENDKINTFISADDNKFQTELTEEEKLSLIKENELESNTLSDSFTKENNAELEEKDKSENNFELKNIDDPEYNPESFGIFGTIKSYLNLFGN